MGSDKTSVSWAVRIASASTDVAKNAANRILEADLAQAIMVLITVAAGVCYGWIEGYVINAKLGNQQLLPYVLFNHFTMYQIAVGTLLGLTTGGFALIKARSMFAKGNRYFLFAVVGNYPFSWAVEDFTYFLFNPLDALSASHWSTWFLGGVYAYSPWMPGNPKPEFFIPSWYFLVFAWFIACNLYAHRCTVYDNLLKDEIGRQLLPKISAVKESATAPVQHSRFHLPNWPHRDKHESKGPSGLPTTVPAPEPSSPPKTPVGTPAQTRMHTEPSNAVVVPERTTKVRSSDAEAALERMRRKWLKPETSS